MRFALPQRVPLAVPVGLRAFFRLVFLLLTLATLGLAYSVLKEEKRLSLVNYAEGVRKNQAQISARLRHPAGQLALLNPAAAGRSPLPLRPLVLPYAALDFDDRTKVQQAVETSGCLVQYADGASICVGVGNNPFAGGFIYVVGGFTSGELVAHRPGNLDLSVGHRAAIEVNMRGETVRWIAPFQATGEGAGTAGVTSGRLTGYVDSGPILPGTRPVRDFRGWLWQENRCIDAGAALSEGCARRSFVSVRLPIELFRDAIYRKSGIVWPPADLERIEVHVRVLPPGEGAALFDSDRGQASLPFSWAELGQLLLPGERLAIRRQGENANAPPLVSLVGAVPDAHPASPLLERLVNAMRVENVETAVVARDTITTSLGRYDLVLTGDARTVNQVLAAVATRMSWFVAAMLGAILLAWLAIEMRIIRRITLLTRRAATVSTRVVAGTDATGVDFSDLRGRDELGVLARSLQELLGRVNEDMRRARIRAEQEKDTWHAVGHEIMSPLQSMMALHGSPDDPSHRYVSRMQQAVRVLYGSASPSEAFQATTLDLAVLDIEEFLAQVARNAAEVGIEMVVYRGTGTQVPVRADEFALEDAITHVLRNADRYRPAGTPIIIALAIEGGDARVSIANQGEAIAPDMLEKIFEYGVSDSPASGAEGNRGQGLFVARTYMAKMGGTIVAANAAGGVEFVLTLRLAAGEAGTHPAAIRPAS